MLANTFTKQAILEALQDAINMYDRIAVNPYVDSEGKKDSSDRAMILEDAYEVLKKHLDD